MGRDDDFRKDTAVLRAIGFGQEAEILFEQQSPATAFKGITGEEEENRLLFTGQIEPVDHGRTVAALMKLLAVKNFADPEEPEGHLFWTRFLDFAEERHLAVNHFDANYPRLELELRLFGADGSENDVGKNNILND
jgi:hypothetical protein